MFLNKMRRPARLGLDINTSHIRWVQIYHTPHQIAQVKAYGVIAVKEQSTEIPEALKSLALKPRLLKSAIGIALPDSSVQKTTLTLEANLSLIQLRKKFKETAASLFNQSTKDIHYQYQVMGFAKNHTSQLNFLVVAVQKQTIEKRLALLKACHLTPNLIDVESFAVDRGQEILKNRQITLEKNVDVNDFIQQSEYLTLSLGLAMHPKLALGSLGSFLSS